MRAPQRPAAPGLIQQLLDHPTRFQLFQALRLLLRWLEQLGHADARSHLRCHSRVAAAFPPGELDAVWARTPGNNEIRTCAQLAQALADHPGQLIHLTPAGFGLLGNSSALPAHYTQAIVNAERQHDDGGARAFLDLLGNRATLQFYQAWARYRIECQSAGQDQFLSLQLALAGSMPAAATSTETLPAQALGYYGLYAVPCGI